MHMNILFAGNLKHEGRQGQCEFRGRPGYYELPIKKGKCMGTDNFWIDAELAEFQAAVLNSLSVVPVENRWQMAGLMKNLRAKRCKAWLTELLKDYPVC